MVNNRFDLSIILPCYNEAQILEETVKTIQRILDQTVYQYEIIIAEDASTDGTDRIAKQLAAGSEKIVWLHRDQRIGRGSAVADAIKKSRGAIVGFLDADLEAPAHYILPLVLAVKDGADIAVGVRYLHLKWYDFFLKPTKLLSHYGYMWLLRKMLRTNLQDTEAGFKFFNRQKILPVLDEIRDQHWFWDTEVMVRPYLKGYKIKEIPILFSMRYGRVSKVNFLKDSFSHLRNLLRFREEMKAMRMTKSGAIGRE